jgi:hypothetical protein
VGCFAAVVEAVFVVAGVAAEGEEVELVAVGVFAVGADCFDVGLVHGGVGGGFAGGGMGGGRGRHGGGINGWVRRKRLYWLMIRKQAGLPPPLALRGSRLVCVCMRH